MNERMNGRKNEVCGMHKHSRIFPVFIQHCLPIFYLFDLLSLLYYMNLRVFLSMFSRSAQNQNDC